MTDTSNPRGECASPVPGVWVLLVDDDAGIRRLIEEFAAHVGWELVSTPDAQTVLSWIEGGVAPFDLLIVDVAMPGMDGLALVRAVRRSAAWQRTPVLAFTGLALPDERSVILAAGCDGYLAKPVRLKQLRQVCEELLAGRAG